MKAKLKIKEINPFMSNTEYTNTTYKWRSKCLSNAHIQEHVQCTDYKLENKITTNGES